MDILLFKLYCETSSAGCQFYATKKPKNKPQFLAVETTTTYKNTNLD